MRIAAAPASRCHLLLACISLCGAPGLIPLTARAAPATLEALEEQRAEARQLGYAGIAAYQAKQYPEAVALLERAYRLLPVPSLALWSARAMAASGRLVDAAARYREVLGLEVAVGKREVQESAVRDARAELSALEARLPRLRVAIEGQPPAAVTVTVDGRPMPSAAQGQPQPVDPGPITIVARSEAGRVEERIVIEEGEVREIRLLLPAPEAVGTPAGPVLETGASRTGTGARSGWSALGWSGVGVGAAGLLLGVGAGAAAVRDYEALTHLCPDRRCPADGEGRNTLHRFRTLRAVSTAGYAVGVLGATGGGAVLLTRPGSRTKAAVAATPAGVVLWGEL